MYLFISEKPSAMRAVRDAYEHSDKWLGPIEFFALSGHICRLLQPKEYTQWRNRKWEELPLPMVPETFATGVGNVKIFQELKARIQSRHYDGIIVGTDSDLEGNGIYDLIEQSLHLQEMKTYRFFEKDLTKKGILESLHGLTDYHKEPRDVRMTQAYRIRSRFDWLIGYNMSVGYTVRAGFNMRVGRVKAPTLKLVYDNCRAIDTFQPKSSYLPVAVSGEINAFYCDEKWREQPFEEKKDAQEVLGRCGDTLELVSVKKKIMERLPQQLYKLTDIQVEAGQKYGYTPETVLACIQNLYEKYKLLSYPRTDCRYISSEKARELPKLLRAVMVIPGMDTVVKGLTQADIDRVRNDSRYVNNKEVEKSSHDALIPTGKIMDLSSLEEKERNICTMIYKRFLSAFLPPLAEEKTKYLFLAGKDLFTAAGSRVLDEGFTRIFDRSPGERILPALSEEEILKIQEKRIHTVQSRPPKRFTQALLIDAMENLHKYLPKGDYKNILQEAHGIGQPSSRAAIIKELITTGYMEQKKQGLYITEMGRAYIENLSGSSLTDPMTAAKCEEYIKNVREGVEGYGSAYQKILAYLNELLGDLEKAQFNKSGYANKKEMEIDAPCPACGKPIRKHPWGYGCSGYPGCRFSIGKVCGKMLTEKQVISLCRKGSTGVLKGFHAKSGNTFDASLIYDHDTGKLRFEFPKTRR